MRVQNMNIVCCKMIQTVNRKSLQQRMIFNCQIQDLKTGIQIPIHGGLQGLLEISPTIFITLILKVLLIYGGIQTTNIPSMVVAPVQTTTCPAVIYVKDAKSGAKAAEIHTAGSGGGYSSTPATMYPEGAKAGRLFIGTYNWSDKKETVTTGHPSPPDPTE